MAALQAFPTQEQSYKSPMAPNDAIALLDNTELEILDSTKVTKEVIGERPNTYTFTKAIAEELVMTECQGSILVLIWRNFIQFLDLIASLDLGYESDSVTINPNPVTRLLEQSKTGHEHRCSGWALH